MIQNMAKYIDAENDYLYIKGQQKEQEKFVTNLLEKLNLSTEQIADIAGVSVKFVLEVQQKLSSNK